MKPSLSNDVREMYDATADSYAQMMDNEINLPIYSNILSRLHNHIVNIPGTLIDTACGSGHMLSMFREHFDKSRAILGVDLSPRMIAIASEQLGSNEHFTVGDMRDLSMVRSRSAAAVINFFAIHHLAPKDILKAITEWNRVLCSSGQLTIAAWEGSGRIDYGDESDIVAFRYTSEELTSWVKDLGFTVLHCTVEPVDDMQMDAIYLECAKSNG